MPGAGPARPGSALHAYTIENECTLAERSSSGVQAAYCGLVNLPVVDGVHDGFDREAPNNEGREDAQKQGLERKCLEHITKVEVRQ